MIPEVPDGVKVINVSDRCSCLVYCFDNMYYIRGLSETVDFVFDRDEWESFVRMITRAGTMTGVKL